MGMCVRPGISWLKRHTRRDGRRDPTEDGGHGGGRIDAVARVTAVEVWVPTRQFGDEGRGGQQGAIRLPGLDLDPRRGTGEVCEVEGVSGKYAIAAGHCRYR